MKFILLTLALMLITEISYSRYDDHCRLCKDFLFACQNQRWDYKNLVTSCKDKLFKEKKAIVDAGNSLKNYYRCRLNYLEDKWWPRESVHLLTNLLNEDRWGGLEYSRKQLNDAKCVVSTKIIRKPNSITPESCNRCEADVAKCQEDVTDLWDKYVWCFNERSDHKKDLKFHIDRIKQIMACKLKALVTILPEGKKVVETSFTEEDRHIEEYGIPRCVPIAAYSRKARRCVAEGGTPYEKDVGGGPGMYKDIICKMPEDEKEGD